MREETERNEQFDEYLWPLSGEVSAIDWSSLAEELQIRERLSEIMAHVRAAHLTPRLRRLGVQPSATLVQATTQALIAGPVDGRPWEQTLKEPVPRALREEWTELAERLRRLNQERATSRANHS